MSVKDDLYKLYGANLELQNLGKVLIEQDSISNEMKEMIRRELELNQNLLDSLKSLRFKKKETE